MGEIVRSCIVCGGVGPRIAVDGGHAHRYCLPRRVVMALRRERREEREAARPAPPVSQFRTTFAPGVAWPYERPLY